VKYKEVEHVTAESVKRFYRFEAMARSEDHLVFRQGVNMTMTWVVGSDSIRINSIKFSLSYPVIEQQGKILVSRLDLQKLLDPVLRPSYIKNTKPFDTVILDAGHGGHDSGARSSRGSEKSYALDTIKRLQAELEKLGYKTHLIRSGDTFVGLGERVEAANKIEESDFRERSFQLRDQQGSGRHRNVRARPGRRQFRLRWLRHGDIVFGQ